MATPADPGGDPIMVGRVGRAHGIAGDVAVEPRTDDPDGRFALGAVLLTQPAERGPLVVAGRRWHSGRLLLRFEGVADRTAAERLTGTVLVIDPADAGEAGDGAWWDHQLIGLRAEAADGSALGSVTDVVHAPAQDLLVVTRETADGPAEVLVPFVAAIVPDVDVAAGLVRLTPPPGLFDA